MLQCQHSRRRQTSSKSDKKKTYPCFVPTMYPKVSLKKGALEKNCSKSVNCSVPVRVGNKYGTNLCFCFNCSILCQHVRRRTKHGLKIIPFQNILFHVFLHLPRAHYAFLSHLQTRNKTTVTMHMQSCDIYVKRFNKPVHFCSPIWL